MKTYMKCPNPMGRFEDVNGNKFALLEVNPISNVTVGPYPTFEAETKPEAAVLAELTFLGEPASAEFNCPPRLTPRQLRLVLYKNNISIESIETVINGFANQEKKAKALISWNHASYYDRADALLIEVATALGLVKTDINALFRQGVKL